MDKITILLADDHVVVRESIHKFLEDEEFLQVIGEAGDGEEAVRMTKQLKPQVLIMDIDMPKLNGIDATRQVKETCPDTIVLILTAYDYEQYIFALLEVGASGYLLKDVSGRELIKAIYDVYCGQSVLHPAIADKVIKQIRGSYSCANQTEPLTNREKEVLELAATGLKNKEIAKRLFVCVRTIESHLGNVFAKLGVTSRTEAISVSVKMGMFNMGSLIRHKYP